LKERRKEGAQVLLCALGFLDPLPRGEREPMFQFS